MLTKLWNKNCELIFDNNTRTDGSILICEREQVDLKCYKINAAGNDIEIDVAAKSAYENTRLAELQKKRLNEIDAKTEKLITETGYLFKGQTLSSSERHQNDVDRLYSRRNIDPFPFGWGFKISNKDNTAFVTVDTIADIESMNNLLLSHVFSKKQSGNAQKIIINDIVAETTATPSTKTVSQAITALENYVDVRV